MRMQLNNLFIFLIMALVLTLLSGCFSSNKIDQKLLNKASENMSCPQKDLVVTKLTDGFKIEGCNQETVFVECGCCDSFWYEQCDSADNSKWLKLCDLEVRGCIDRCMKARHVAGFDKSIAETKIICKAYDQKFLN